MSRKIIHVDMDCFFAAIEVRENPALRGKPVAVGGSAEGRGVVATCSYEARKFGVHSAMPMGIAQRQCPELVVLPPRFALYKQVSNDIRAIFEDYTDRVEPLSLDEAFLDVSESGHFHGSATRMAEEIRRRIQETQHLTASAGVAPNKFLAKVASDWRKPDGLFVIRPQDVDDFMPALPVARIPGVGKVTALHLDKLGVTSCGQLQAIPLEELEFEFGSFGASLYRLCRGIDDRPVDASYIRKSLSVEDTFAQDLPTLDACLQEIPILYAELLKRLERAREQQRLLPKALFVKLRFHDFVTTTVQITANMLDCGVYTQLCGQAWERGQRPVRLLGVGVQFADPHKPEQLKLPLAG
jgi:DNA polymerase-4